ncbi:hypothetical protein Cgig2_015275 [Carnegiea gigantea]|uniref:Uncharacterized protein n=1 Tax=Carnegiea gigantea TaxID=171969 RepID=A0A9Q1K8K5_9CARY|nr:hypothetical protein Cgig2_015275 [Carnegiea gigantea]
MRLPPNVKKDAVWSMFDKQFLKRFRNKVFSSNEKEEGQGSRLEVAYRKRVISKEYLWFDRELSRAIFNSIKSFYIGSRKIEGVEKRSQCLKNRTKGPSTATLQCQGLISTSQLARKMIKEGNTPTPSTLFARSHKYVADITIDIYLKYEALRVESSIILKRGHKWQRGYTMRFQVDGVRNLPLKT